MMHTWFECKIRYEKTMENGMNKKVTEPYLVDALSFTEAEARIIEEMTPYISGEFTVNDIKRANYSELFFAEDANADRWFKCKLTFITLDLRTMKWTKESLGFPTVNDTQMTFSTESVRWSSTCQVNGSGLTFRIGDKTITENAESGTYEVSLDLRDAADIKFELKKL